jgi:NDP-sugar pyrophosphorylase family protein
MPAPEEKSIAQRIGAYMIDIPALILAGGQGTRLPSVLPETPRVLTQVGGRPFLAHLLDWLADGGVREVILCTGYRAEQITRAFSARYRDMFLYYSWEPQPLGTGGALRRALGLTHAETVLALNGESFVCCDLTAFMAWHQSRGFAGSLAVAEVGNAAQLTTVRVNEGGAIQSFEEKRGRCEPGWVNGGVSLLSRRLLESLPEGRTTSLKREALPAWLAGGLGGYLSSGTFLDIRTPQSLAQAEALLAGLGTAS